MSFHYLDYPAQARRLADAGGSLLEAIDDPDMDVGIVIVELEAAASTLQGQDFRARFEASGAAPAVAARLPEEVLSALLLEFQSANALMSAGLAMNEHGAGADSKFLNDAVTQIRSASADLGLHIASSARMQFEPQKEPSATVDSALKAMQDSAEKTIESIAGGTESTISAAFGKLKDVDPSKVSQAIDNLGKSFEIVATAGRLIRLGLEKLKAVVDALSKLFGDNALADIKTRVREIWQKAAPDKTFVRSIIGVTAARKRVSDFAAQPGLEISGLDGVSRELALLEDKYQGIRKILDGLMAAVVLAMGIVAALQLFGLWVVAPWVALAAGGAYAAIIGGALLAGMNYTGSRPMLGWIRGVYEIIPEPLSKAAQ